jgi:hypothetical protein
MLSVKGYKVSLHLPIIIIDISIYLERKSESNIVFFNVQTYHQIYSINDIYFKKKLLLLRVSYM